jgi:DNA primase
MDFVEHLKSSIDIVKVVGEYVRLRRVGGSPRYMGLCPFHTEKTPSFSVHQAHQFYKCFGCGAGGDVLKFVMELEGLSFYEALRLLAERNGIPMPKRAEYSDEETKLRAAIYRMHEIAAAAFQSNLGAPSGADAREYLARRGVSPEIAAEFALGYSERSGQDLARRFEREGFPPDQLEVSGLLLKRQDGSGFFDRFRGRLMFPLHNETGKIIGFGGRALSAQDEPKYLNSPETPVYRKSYVLYNLHRAKEAIRKSDRAILVEGYMDVIGVWSGGVREVVATCGTALTGMQVKTLKRHSDRIVVNFDPDVAGSSAAERSIQTLLEEGVHIRVLELEGGHDPDEYVRTVGAAIYREKVEQAPGYFHWLADRARAKHDMRTAEGRVAALQFLLPAVRRVSDKLERATIAGDLASYLGVEPGIVLDHFRRAAAERREEGLRQAREPVRAVEKILLNAMLASEEAREETTPRLRETPELERFQTRRIFEALFALHAGGREFRFSELEARLEERDKSLLSSVVFAEDVGGEADPVEQARACMARLEAEARESEKAGLRAKVKEAERAGDLSEALRLTGELSRLG